METKKRIVSGAISLSMGLQTLLSIGAVANAENQGLISIDRNVNEICVMFGSETSARASVVAADMSVKNVETKIVGDKLIVSTDELENGTYYLKVEDENLFKMYSFDVNNMSDEYQVFGKNDAAYVAQTPIVKDGWTFMIPGETENDKGVYTWTDAEGQERSVDYAKKDSFMYNKDYKTFKEEKTGIEFDFKDSDLSSTKNGLYSAFRVIFNASENTGAPDMWNIWAQSAQGAYILSLAPYNNERIDAYLHKWNGAVDKAIQPGGNNLTSSKNSTKLVQNLNAIADYAVGKEYRFKVESEPVGNDVQITVWTAEYTDGVLGEWVEIISYKDVLKEATETEPENKPLPAGTVWFYTDGSYEVGNSGGYFTSYYTKDISVGDISISEMELSAPVLESVSGNDKITLKFSEAIAENTLENIKVYDINGDDTYCDIYLDEDDHSKVIVDLAMLDTGDDYHLSVGEDVKSAMGLNAERQYDYLFDYDCIYNEFEGDGTADEWVFTRWANKPRNVYTYDGAMFLGGTDPATSTHTFTFTNVLNSDKTVSYVKTIPLNENANIVYHNNYMDYSGENTALEFDYKSNAYTACYDENGNKYYLMEGDSKRYGYYNGTWENTRVFFNGENFAVNSNHDKITSDNGAYFLEINNYGKSVSLRKWNGEELSFGSTGRIGTMLAKVDTIPGFVEESVVRYRIETENTDTGVLISVYIAYYNEDGYTDDWTKIISYEDTENPKTAGSFWFSTTGSNKAMYGYAYSVVIDNLWHAKTEFTSLDDIADDLKERIDAIYNSENWELYKDEISTINDEVSAYIEITGSFDASYMEKLEKLISGKSNDEISKELFDKLSQKENLKIAFIGGSLTDGGADYRESFKEYISEKTGVPAENITTINAGNGGQGSAWHQVRIYDEVMSENPDMVIIDFCGNDDGYYNESSSMADGTNKSALALEVTIRRLLNMENAPAIMVNMIPAGDRLIKTGLLNKGIKVYSNGSKIIEINVPSYTLTIPVCTYYDVPVMNLTDEFIKYTELKYKDEQGEWNGDIPVKYYHKEDNVYTECEATDENAVLGTPLKQSEVEIFVDYDKLNSHFGKEYNFNTAEYGNIWKALSGDGTHPTKEYDGYKLYGDMMIELMEKDSIAAPRIVTMPEKPIIALSDVYDEFNMTKKELSVANINALDCYNIDTTNGGTYTDVESFTSTNGRNVSGVTLTGPVTLTYRFDGNVFYAVTSNADVLKKYATIDDKTYISTARYYNNTLLSNADEHIFKLELPEGVSVNISGFYVDEDTLLNNFQKNGKYTMVDLSTVANVYGAYRNGDGVVYGSEDSALKNGAKADTQIYYKENNWSNVSPDGDKIYDYFTSEDYEGTPFNVEALNNRRYRALTVNTELVQQKWDNWSLSSEIDKNGANLKIPTVDVPDDYYSNIHLLVNNNNTGSTIPKVVLQVNFADGTSEDVSFESLNTVTEESVGVKQLIKDTGKNHNTGAASGTFVINEYTVSLPTGKRINSIGFKYETSSYYRIYGMTLEKVYDAGLLDVEFEFAGNYVEDISQYALMPLTVKTKVDNRTDATLYVVFYDGEKLVKVNSFDIDTTDSMMYENVIKNNITVPESFDKVSAYLWSADGSMKPLTVGIEK